MSKYDDVLNELVYKIDEVVYDYYIKSNEMIAKKRSQDSLLAFRDQTLDTINEMNVRSMEIISGLKDREMMEERGERLLERNRSIVASSLEVIQSAPVKNEFLDDVSQFASGVYTSAKDTVHKIEESGILDRAAATTQKGIQTAKESLDDFMSKPRVQEGTKKLKETSRAAVATGSELVQEGIRHLNKWLSEDNTGHGESHVKDSKPKAEHEAQEEDENHEEKSNNL